MKTFKSAANASSVERSSFMLWLQKGQHFEYWICTNVLFTMGFWIFTLLCVKECLGLKVSKVSEFNFEWEKLLIELLIRAVQFDFYNLLLVKLLNIFWGLNKETLETVGTWNSFSQEKFTFLLKVFHKLCFNQILLKIKTYFI